MKVIEADRHPFDQAAQALRYFVVFWCDRPEGLTEIQALVRSTENDVAEVLAWAKREAASPGIGASHFQLYVVVEHMEGDPWLLLLSGPDDTAST